MTETKRAILLLSGGLDSTTVAALATRRDGYTCTALSFDYGQQHAVELDSARRVATILGISDHVVMRLPAWGGSALNSEIPVALDRPISEMSEGIPDTYVPARNTIFLAYATALAETRDAERIYIGVNALDYSGYPDCRPAFVEAFQDVIDVGTRMGDETGEGPEIVAPLIELTKAEIIRFGTQWDAPYQVTHSCYQPVAGEACGRCDSCTLRLAGFAEAGIPDPITYATATA
jgi:7-cyano-7-deazaguanine synthase